MTLEDKHPLGNIIKQAKEEEKVITLNLDGISSTIEPEDNIKIENNYLIIEHTHKNIERNVRVYNLNHLRSSEIWISTKEDHDKRIQIQKQYNKAIGQMKIQ